LFPSGIRKAVAAPKFVEAHPVLGVRRDLYP
jgi:hypothetical protein